MLENKKMSSTLQLEQIPLIIDILAGLKENLMTLSTTQ